MSFFDGPQKRASTLKTSLSLSIGPTEWIAIAMEEFRMIQRIRCKDTVRSVTSASASLGLAVRRVVIAWRDGQVDKSASPL